jgi:hypothetical protein
MSAERFTAAMGTCRPGYLGEEAAVVTVAPAAAAATLYTVPADQMDAIYWVRVPRDAAGAEQQVRIKAPGPATILSSHQSSNEERVAIGPLCEGETISYWRDCAAAIVIEIVRIS